MASSFRTTGRKIVAIGRNYAAHARELNNPLPKEPFFFLKPTTSYVDAGNPILIPHGVSAHFEVELGAVIGETARDVKEADAMKYVAGYALGVDMTARNVQRKAQSQKYPWTTAKGFDTFTPIGEFIPASKIKDPNNVRLWLKTNGETRQDGNTRDMIFKLPKLIEFVSSIMTLEKGDLILTGTPEGVGEVKPEDTLTCGLETQDPAETLSQLEFPVKQRQGLYEFTPDPQES